jgi:ribosome-associated heat shock protein Hsp15
VNGVAAKPHRDVHPGDELVITRPLGRRQRVRVLDLAETHIPRADARKLYEDLTPPPTPEEVEMRRLARLARPFISPPGVPHRRDRRLLRKMRGKG